MITIDPSNDHSFDAPPPIDLGDEYLNRKAKYDCGFRYWSRELPAGEKIIYKDGNYIKVNSNFVEVGVQGKFTGRRYGEIRPRPLTKQEHIAQYTDADYKGTGYGCVAKMAEKIMAIDQKVWDEFWSLKIGDTFLGKTCGSWHVDKEFRELIFTSYCCWIKPGVVDYLDFSKQYGHSEVFIHAFGGIVKRYDPLNPPKCPFDQERS